MVAKVSSCCLIRESDLIQKHLELTINVNFVGFGLAVHYDDFLIAKPDSMRLKRSNPFDKANSVRAASISQLSFSAATILSNIFRLSLDSSSVISDNGRRINFL